MKIWRKFSTAAERTGPRARLGLLAALTVLAALLSLCLGPVSLSLRELLQVLAGSGSETAATILLYVRLPRTLGCLLAGCALAVSGAVIQSVLANPLAAPGTIGVNAGAGFLVAVCCAVAPGAVTAVPLAAFLGAFGSALLVLGIGERTGASRLTLVLAGVAVSQIFSAGIDALLTFFPDALSGYSDFRIGGLTNLTTARLLPAAVVILACLALLLALAGDLDILLLGSDTAQSLGLPVRRFRILFLALAAALAGAAVSFAGLLNFVGLLVPHIMRRLTGEESRVLLPACALGGAALVTLCDLAARTLFSPYELPVGILLALLGGPFFLWLLLRQRRRYT